MPPFARKTQVKTDTLRVVTEKLLAGIKQSFAKLGQNEREEAFALNNPV
jgi:hypothetical protein